MSQHYHPREGRSSSGSPSSARPSNARSSTNPINRSSGRPHYMAVGSGSTSASAAALMATLDNDSGYGGSIAGDSQSNDGGLRGWHPGMTADRPTPGHTPVKSGESNAACESGFDD